jgi:hypothetical protein
MNPCGLHICRINFFFLEVIEISLNALGIPRYTRSIQEKKPSYKQKEQGNHDN